LANQLTGCLAMLNYVTIIFKEAGSNLSPMLSTIIVTIIQVMGTYTSTLFVERAGRKTLLLISTTGICLGESSMASYYYLTSWEILRYVFTVIVANNECVFPFL